MKSCASSTPASRTLRRARYTPCFVVYAKMDILNSIKEKFPADPHENTIA